MDHVTSPADSPPADPTAVIGRRIVAWLIDFVIYGGLVGGTFAAVTSSRDVGSQFEAEEICGLVDLSDDIDSTCIVFNESIVLVEPADWTTIILVSLVYGVVTQLLLPIITGFSPGKAMVGLRVVDQNTFAKAGAGAQFVRLLLWVVDGAVYCFPLVGLITGLSSNGHRRVGDIAANTVVIDKMWVDRPLPIPGVTQGPAIAYPAGVTAPPVTGSPPPPPTGSTITSPPPPVSAAPPPGSAAPPPPMAATSPPPSTDAPPSLGPAVAPPASASPRPRPDAGAPPADPTPPPPAAPTPPPPPPAAAPPPPPPPPTPPAPEPSPEPSRPGVDAPQWDADRDTYIQWDPELSDWMQWDEAVGTWVPISR